MCLSNLLNVEKIYHLYQPIINLETMEIVGYEALLRTNTPTPIHSNIFSIAKNEGCLYSLDTLSISKAINVYCQSKEYDTEKVLFINIYPSTIINPEFIFFINSLNIENLNVVFEINEYEDINDFDELLIGIKLLKDKNIKIAIDDIGKGNLEIFKILELNPHVIKIDSSITRGITESLEKQLFSKLLVDYCKQLGIELVFEGIENKDTLIKMKKDGVIYGQGYLLGKPYMLNSL
ncbi:EAL domain-containing protein [Ornithinibacillus sp. 179-J 7C1 HS]|uniref:EAL domain-containing protein n=1 Tax=Ornithinibacillus sp. 179-J 7C1 HS TaxID=3142384 RepID=UPI0039A3A6BA